MTEELDAARRTARRLLEQWKGGAYAFGTGCLARAGRLCRELGARAAVIANASPWLAPTVEGVCGALASAQVAVAARTEGARPNAPRDDVYRMQDAIRSSAPDAIVAIGGGSTIDAAKAAVVLAALAGDRHDIEPFFGVGKVTEVLAARAGRLPPLLAVQTASGSGAHLTKYSNITDPAGRQKKLVIDNAIVPARAVFDYAVTRTAPADLTADGAFDGLCHILEAYYGAPPGEIERLEAIARAAVELIVSAVRQAVEDPGDLAAREALGLGTDLGGLAIMVGSTSGPHLNSFSLVDVLSHGRAVAVLEPYYTVFFAPAIGRQLRMLAEILSRAGLIRSPRPGAEGRDLGLAVAEGMIALARSLHFPTRLGEIPGFSDAHVARALSGAKNPQLASKLQAMPVALAAGEVDEYMGAVLRAARDGDLSAVPRAPRRARGLAEGGT